jgi:hypothetical protein
VLIGPVKRRIVPNPNSFRESPNWPWVRSAEKRSDPRLTNSCIQRRADVFCGASPESKMEIPPERKRR